MPVGGLDHIAITVTDLPGFCDELAGKGVEFISEPVTFKLEHGSVTVVFLRDPDGNFVELVEQYH